jgi:hypothetical protein
MVFAARDMAFALPPGPGEAPSSGRVGLDLDGVITRNHSKLHCQMTPDDASASQVDGADGIDNSFGGNVVSLIGNLEPEFVSQMNADVMTGKFTQLLSVSGIGPNADYNVLDASLVSAASRSEPPTWHNDVWPRLALNEPPSTFSNTYLTRNTLVATGSTGITTLVITIHGVPVHVRLQNVSVVADLSADHLTIERGIIAGIASVDDLIAEFLHRYAFFAPVLCGGNPLLDLAVKHLHGSADIMLDGTQDPTRACDGVSFGMFFHAVTAQEGATGSESPLPPSACEANSVKRARSGAR